MKKEYFKDIVGQDRAKKKLKFFIDGQTASGVLPHLMFVAPKGCGKTTLAKAAGSKLINRIENVGKTKTFLEINCSTLKSVKQFFNPLFKSVGFDTWSKKINISCVSH